MKVYASVVMESEVWPTAKFMHFLFQMTLFYYTAWQMK